MSIDNLNYNECAAYYDRLILQSKCKVEDDCAVCLEPLLEKNVIYLPCKHFFHSNCLNQMIKAKTYTCPLCRYNLINSLYQIGHNFYYDLNEAVNVNANAINVNANDTTWDDLFFNIITDYAGVGAGAEGAGAGAVAAVDASANVVGANVVGANVVGANVVGANEVGANEVGANVVGANEAVEGSGTSSIIRAYLVFYTS